MFGEDGNDSLFGGQNDGRLFGEAGDDQLSGDLGNDTLTGGAGSDFFVLGPGDDVAIDFDDEDGIFATFAPTVTAVPEGTRLGTPGHSITLLGVSPSELDFLS